METAIIIVLAFMLLISVTIFNIKYFNIKGLNIKYQACVSALDKLKKENDKIKSKNADLKNSNIDLCNSKINELELKYQSALGEIFESKETIKSYIYQINKYDKCNKQISEELIKKNNVIEDAWNVIRELEKEKYKAIGQSKKALNLCNEMANKLIYLNSELELIESELKSKLNS
jgi:chromosome segregation ATPase